MKKLFSLSLFTVFLTAACGGKSGDKSGPDDNEKIEDVRKMSEVTELKLTLKKSITAPVSQNALFMVDGRPSFDVNISFVNGGTAMCNFYLGERQNYDAPMALTAPMTVTFEHNPSDTWFHAMNGGGPYFTRILCDSKNSEAMSTDHNTHEGHQPTYFPFDNMTVGELRSALGSYFEVQVR